MASKGEQKKWADWAVKGAVVAVAFAVWDYLFGSIWLAATQWLLIAAVLLGFAIYLRGR